MNNILYRDVGWLVICSLRTACSNKDYCSPVLCRQPALHHLHRTAVPFKSPFATRPGSSGRRINSVGIPSAQRLKNLCWKFNCTSLELDNVSDTLIKSTKHE